MQDYDVLSRCHPAVNFLFFAAAIVLTVVLFHPAYLLVSLLCGGAYYAVLRRARCAKTLGFLLIAMVLVAAVNPLFNTLGETTLFTLFGRPYTWQALCYGGCAGMMLAAVSLWFLCGGIVMTSDKFTSLFGNLIPAISLLLVGTGWWIISMKSMSSTTASEDFVLYARYRGLSEGKIGRSYVFRNSILTQVTALAMSLGGVFNGSIMTEIIFSYPGVGTLIQKAILQSDYNMILGCITISIVAISTATLIADLIYPLIDPRIRYS